MNPFKKFNQWFNLAKKHYPFDHTAFALSTSYNNKPYVRMVLLKKILPDGYVFFTNIESNKGKQFTINKNLAMCFYWENLNKQIRVTGRGEVIDDKSSDKYFFSRPKGSQIGAWASDQSREVRSRKSLLEKYKFFEKKFKKNLIERPKYWVGIKIIPCEFEFWQQGNFRMHKREVYYLKSNSWRKKILSP
tara:strand:- start:116 stop:685 length:570 start_codon:yes stop_codon:yes gene_type:complete